MSYYEGKAAKEKAAAQEKAAEKNTANQSAMIGLLQQIVDILQTSTIAEERGKDVRSKFWAAYKRVSGEFDDNMLERCNSNMDIILIFAGLFSAANTAFIIAMQPNSVDTTNALLVQLIQITLYGPSAVQPTSLSPSADYSSNFWTQALAYMSLALSLLAAFGAVLGKQWLNYYKTHRYGGGSLEERCKQRHDKFEGLETWWFESMLQSFSDLLKASLFLFGVSLAAWMWTQQRTISILIISTTAFGFACYVITILASVIYPNCPFQTRLSLAIRAVLYRNPQPKEDSTASAMDWMLKTSTYPDAVRSALELLPIMPHKPNVNLESLCENVLGVFKACFNLEGHPIVEDAVTYGKALVQFSWNDPHARAILSDRTHGWDFWKSWHTVYLSRAVAQCQNSYRQKQETNNAVLQLRHQADIRTAMRMVIPNDVGWIWGGKFELEQDHEKADLFNNIAMDFLDTQDFEAAGDALILSVGSHNYHEPCDHQNPYDPDDRDPYGSNYHHLNDPDDRDPYGSNHHHLNDPDYRDPYVPVYRLSYHPSNLIQFLDKSDESHKLCHSALHAACLAFDNLVGDCDSDFREAVLKAISPENDRDNFQFTNAIQLLNFTEWPTDSPLAGSPLSDIQRMLLHVLPEPSLDNPAQYIPFCRALIGYMGSDKPSDSRRVAFHRACDLRQDLAMITTDGVDPSLRDMVLSELYPALLTIVHADWSGRTHYLRLIFTLANAPDWLTRLDKDGHIAWCISIIPELQESHDPYFFYPVGILLRVQLAHPERAAPQLSAITGKQWWNMMRVVWCIAGAYLWDPPNHAVYVDVTEVLEALVTGTEMYMPHDISNSDLRSFLENLDNAVRWLGKFENGKKAKSVAEGLKSGVYRRLMALQVGPAAVGQSSESAG